MPIEDPSLEGTGPFTGRRIMATGTTDGPKDLLVRRQPRSHTGAFARAVLRHVSSGAFSLLIWVLVVVVRFFCALRAARPLHASQQLARTCTRDVRAAVAVVILIVALIVAVVVVMIAVAMAAVTAVRHGLPGLQPLTPPPTTNHHQPHHQLPITMHGGADAPDLSAPDAARVEHRPERHSCGSNCGCRHYSPGSTDARSSGGELRGGRSVQADYLDRLCAIYHTHGWLPDLYETLGLARDCSAADTAIALGRVRAERRTGRAGEEGDTVELAQSAAWFLRDAEARALYDAMLAFGRVDGEELCGRC
ncbi:hypothetical protein GGR56DRAFT_154016 [Xylariaceae sp. FL0804]|nr:hypothetical protein GGR56DRAFT_154016 [Xylariaceae sp. FL0804]